MTDFCRFLILTEIVLNHMTKTAEILPKGLTVERNDFDRCNKHREISEQLLQEAM